MRQKKSIVIIILYYIIIIIIIIMFLCLNYLTIFLRGSMSALSFPNRPRSPKLPGDVKD